jgi:hypothetical protein
MSICNSNQEFWYPGLLFLGRNALRLYLMRIILGRNRKRPYDAKLLSPKVPGIETLNKAIFRGNCLHYKYLYFSETLIC